MARTAPDAYTIITPNPHIALQPIVAGPNPTIESLAMMAKNINHAERFASKVFVVQPCQADGQENYITLTTTADGSPPDGLYYWYLDHLPADQSLRVLARYKTEDGGSGNNIGFQVDAIEPDGTVTNLYQDVVSSGGAWADFDQVLDVSGVADTTDPHIIRFGIYQDIVDTALSLKTITVMTSAPATLPAGVSASGFAPLDTDAWDADSPLATAQMKQAYDNILCILADRRSTFLNWSELWLGDRADDIISGEVSAYAYRAIAAIPVKYMPGTTQINWAICWYYGDASDEVRFYSGHETANGGTAGHTSDHASGTVDPGDHSHWYTGHCHVKPAYDAMGEDWIFVEFTTTVSRGAGILGIAVWE